MLILYRLLCPKVPHVLPVRKMCGTIQQTLSMEPDDPVEIVSGSVDLPTLWSAGFCYARILIFLSVGIVHRLKGLCTNANSLSNTLRICIIMAS